MDNNLKLRIQEDMKTAMKSRDMRHLGVIRLLMAAIKQREVDERISLDDSQILAVIDKMLKQRQDSISQFQAAARHDLVQQEEYEFSVLKGYLPPALTMDEIASMIQQVISRLEAASIKDMGRVMAELKPQLQGRADMTLVSQKVKELLER